MLIKSETVLRIELEIGEHVKFVSRYDDTNYIHRVLVLDRQDWIDMGSPKTVTITVQPGDRLNAELAGD